MIYCLSPNMLPQAGLCDIYKLSKQIRCMSRFVVRRQQLHSTGHELLCGPLKFLVSILNSSRGAITGSSWHRLHLRLPTAVRKVEEQQSKAYDFTNLSYIRTGPQGCGLFGNEKGRTNLARMFIYSRR